MRSNHWPKIGGCTLRGALSRWGTRYAYLWFITQLAASQSHHCAKHITAGLFMDTICLNHYELMPPHSLVESAPAVALWAPLQGARLRGQGVAARNQNVVFTVWYLQHRCRFSKRVLEINKVWGRKRIGTCRVVLAQYNLSQKALGQQMCWGNSQMPRHAKRILLTRMGEIGFKCDFILGMSGLPSLQRLARCQCENRIRHMRSCHILSVSQTYHWTGWPAACAQAKHDRSGSVPTLDRRGDIIDSSQIYDENE